MIEVVRARPEHVEGIVSVCSDGYRATYVDLHTQEYIEKVISDFYNDERVLKEVENSSKDWGGYFVALDGDQVVGAAGGGMTGDETGELFVIYLDPTRRNEGIGSLLLEAVTDQQKDWGVTTQWVSVVKENQKGIPFYEARGFIFQAEQDNWLDAKATKTLRYKREI
ncbi:GNAT family N-acetyltransferase [Floricoccus penangensis]|uniref:GNAT family N-acetyltransferase n=1 Tax=Floricoccus penangensis TaxID=1859475 RepID=A0A9Q5JFD5_9LACT|nr:GNAT family N-acetyltransferase [Floricoccus penangensis]OFI45774.1 GNAT family N-acetyltransferase [Floricoccus penangensis]